MGDMRLNEWRGNWRGKPVVADPIADAAASHIRRQGDAHPRMTREAFRAFLTGAAVPRGVWRDG